jgi:tRNA(adenine34) deaminase
MAFKDCHWHMGSALSLAHKAFHRDEVPVGCLIVDNQSGEILAQSHNLKEANHNPLGHAELIAIEEAARKIKNWRLTNTTLYVTLEPCPMCLAAMVQSRISRCVFGAYDSKGGALSLGYYLNQDKRLNHQFSVMGGVQHWECSQILSQYFKEKRQKYSDANK